MNIPLWLTAAITVGSSLALIADRLRPDLIALLVMAALGVSGLTSPAETFAGFSGTATMTILAISIIAEGLTQSGVTRALGNLMKRLAGQSEARLMVVTMLAGAVISLFMNNVAALGVLMPAAIGLSRQTRVAPSRLLMPLSFGVIVGGMATLFTTSNIIMSGALRDAGYRPFGILDFLPIGLPLIVVATLYMLLIGRRMLPVRYPAKLAHQLQQVRSQLIDMYGIKRALYDLKVSAASTLADRTIQEGQWAQRLGLTIVGIMHDGQLTSAPGPQAVVRAGDVVLGFGEVDPERFEALGLNLLKSGLGEQQILDDESTLAEVVIPPHSNLAGKSLGEVHLRERFNLNILAVWRAGKPLYHDLAGLQLLVGDGLLAQTTLQNLRLVRDEHNLVVLEEDADAVLRPRKARFALLIGLAVLVVAFSEWLPVSIASLAGAVLMVLTGCLTMDEAYQSIDWKAIFLIAGLWPLSTAIGSSGLAHGIVQTILGLTSGASPGVLVGLLLFVTALLTNVMAGQSAAPIILAPIGISIARATGLDVRALSMAIALGCSLAFLTPIGHPVNVMVMGAGGYTFKDFLKVGGPLTALLFVVILAGLHLFWGL